MRKKTVCIIIIIIALLVIVTCGIWFITNKNTNVTPSTEQTNPSTEPSESLNPTTPTTTMPKEINLTIKHLPSNYEFIIQNNSKYDQFDYKFNTPPCSTQTSREIAPGKTYLLVEEDEKVPDDVFVFGGLNLSMIKTTEFNDLELVYFSFRGSTNWEIFGITTDMSKNEVIDTLGLPTKEYETAYAYFIEYSFDRDDHTHLITISFDKTATHIDTIEWLRDNLPVYEGEGITESELQELLKQQENS